MRTRTHTTPTVPVSSRFGSPRRPLQCVTTPRTSFDATARNRQLMARCKWFALRVFCSRRGSARGYVRQLWMCLMLATGFGSKLGSLMWTRPYTRHHHSIRDNRKIPSCDCSTQDVKSTSADRVQSQVKSCWFCDWKGGTGTGFIWVLRFSVPISIPWTAQHSFIIVSFDYIQSL
jgi:hypothetical protein